MLSALNAPTTAQQKGLDALGISTRTASGEFVGMRSITEQLAGAHGRLSEAEYDSGLQAAFGSDAIRAGLVVAQAGTAGWDDMSASVGKAGGAQEVAAAKTQGLSGAIGKFTSQVQDVALALYEKFSPALQGVVGFATDMVGALSGALGWFMQLPAPIQAGATALTALIVLKGPLMGLWASMMASGVGLAIQGEMLAARLAVQSLRLEAAASGTSMSLLGAGMRVAGIAAVGLGNSLKAAFLSNPIGLALVAATTALTFFMSATDEAAGSTADFTGAIDENTGALSENAPAVIASASAKSGAFAAYKAIGGSVKEYTDALLGNTGAQDELHTRLLDTATAAIAGSNAWGRYVASGQSLGKSARETASDILATGDAGQFASAGLDAAMNASRFYAAESDKLGTEATQTNDVLEATGGVAGGAAGGLTEVAGAADAAGGAASDAKSPMDLLKAATEGLGAAAAYADTATQFLTAALDAASGNAISQEQATRLNEAAFRSIGDAARDYAAAQDGVTAAAIGVREAQAKVDEVTKNLGKSQKDGGTTADDLTSAQLALAEANRTNDAATGKVADATDRQFDANIKAQQSALELASSAYATAASNGNLAGAAKAANAVIEVQRARFIAAQSAADQESGAAAQLAEKLFGIPGAVGTKISETGGDATKLKAEQVRDALGNIVGYKMVTIDTNAGTVAGEINGLQRVINNLTGKSVTIQTIRQEVVRGTVLATPFAGGAINDYVAAAKSKATAAGFWGGGKLPGTPPSDPTVDNIPAVGPGGTPFRVRSNEWVISEPASKFYGDARMDAINNMTYPRLSPGAGSMTSAGGGSQPINLTLTLLGDGPITEAALQAAQATVDGALRDVALSVQRSRAQS
jgi:hypothetical protein